MMDTKRTRSESPVRKLCIVVDNLDPHAGWGRLAGELSHQLIARGWEVGFVVGSGQTSANVLVVPLRDFSFGSIFAYIRSVLRIRKFLRPYDVVLCYDVNPYGITICIAALGLDTRVVIHALGTYSLFTRSRVRNMLIAWAYRQADRILIVSEFVRRRIELNGFRFESYDVVPVGVDTDRFSKKKSPSHTRPYIISVGGIKKRKGYHLTIPAFSRIAARYPRLRYVIVGTPGDDAYADQLRNIILDEKLTGRVEFLSDVSDEELVALYSGAELYVQTSVTTDDAIEGFGMSYLEAGACGLPAVGARESGAEAAIEDGVTGFLVKHDPEDIAQAMSRILDNPGLSKQMGEAAIAHAKNFSWEHVADQYRMYLNGVLR